MYYSATMNGFYPAELKDDYEAAGAWPDDVVEISDEEYKALLEGQDNGQVISPGDDGKPELVTPESEHVSQTGTHKGDLLNEAETVIRMLERLVKYGKATEEEKESLEEWERYSILLYRVSPDSTADIQSPHKP